MPVLVLEQENGGQRFPIFKNITRIGSSASSDILLNHESITPDHAHILRDGDEMIIASLGRGRPVFVNAKKEKRATLRDGDQIRLGELELTFHLHAPSKQEATTTQAHLVSAYQEIVGFSEKLLRTEDMDSLLTNLMDSVIEITHATKGFLILFESGNPDIRVARNINQEDLKDAVDELSDSILAKVVREQQPVIVEDAINDSEFKACVSVINLKVSSVMCVPLMEGGELIGLIYLGSDQIASLFQHAMLEAVTVFASQASLLIRNAMLLNTLRSDNEQLRKAVTGEKSENFGKIIGTSAPIMDVFNKIRISRIWRIMAN